VQQELRKQRAERTKPDPTIAISPFAFGLLSAANGY